MLPPNGLLNNTYAELPSRFYARVNPTPVAAPRLIRFNAELAAQLGMNLDPQRDPLAAVFSGNQLLPGSEPLAMAYAGHQFGHFVPQLGDGRALLIGEVYDSGHALYDIQLKGAGRTPFSRGGDGRAAMGPVLREYLVSEAMTALGVPSTRTLAAVSSGEKVFRDVPLPGAILTRVAASHVRVGTFQYFAARGDTEAVERLAAYVIKRHFPNLEGSSTPHLDMLREITLRQGRLMAQWLQVGFIHGVMNTDNTAVSGETIDFGPCAFLDVYDPNAVFSSIDRHGRYAYSNQATIAQWNLARLAETLLPLINSDEAAAIEAATEALAAFTDEFERHWIDGMRRKIGLASASSGDFELIQRLLSTMQQAGADFTQTFRSLGALCHRNADVKTALGAHSAQFEGWLTDWRSRGAQESIAPEVRMAQMYAANPKYIPRNHRIEQVIAAAVERHDYTLFDKLLRILGHPFDEQPEANDYAAAPRPEERVVATFCGT